LLDSAAWEVIRIQRDFLAKSGSTANITPKFLSRLHMSLSFIHGVTANLGGSHFRLFSAQWRLQNNEWTKCSRDVNNRYRKGGNILVEDGPFAGCQ